MMIKTRNSSSTRLPFLLSMVVVMIGMMMMAVVVVIHAWVPPSASSRRRTSKSTRMAAADTTSTTAAADGQYTLDGHDIRGPITPLHNIILVKVKETLMSTGGGILLPDQSKERPTEGIVIACGPGKLHPFTGVRITCPIAEGQSVLYGKFDGRPIEYNGDECQVIRDDDVLLAYTGVTMKLDNVIAIRDWVLIETVDQGDDALTLSSGIAVASQVMAELETCEGRVVKVGEGRMASDGNFAQPQIAVGDYVKYKDYAGNDIRIEGKSYSIVKMVDILATLNE